MEQLLFSVSSFFITSRGRSRLIFHRELECERA